MIDIKKMSAEWRRKGFKDKAIAEAIGITPSSLSTKVSHEHHTTHTQAAIICNMIHSPIDMFIKEEAK